VTEPPHTPQTGTSATRGDVIAGVVLSGLAIGFLPFAFAWWVSTDFGKWEVILGATLTNIGTTLLLAAVLFFLQRNFTRTVQTAVTETTKREVSEQTADIKRSAEALQLQVADIAEQLDQRRQNRAEAQAAVVERASAGTSFESVADLLETAAALECLWHGSIALPAGAAFDSPRVRLFWGEDYSGQFRVGNIFEDANPGIVINYEVPDDQQQGGYRPARTAWREGQSPAEALDALVVAMQRAGHIVAANAVKPDLFDHLANALREAMAARTEPSETWMRGRIDEWITDDWAITDQGLENRIGLGVPADQFPDPGVDAGPASSKTPRRKFNPPVPSGVDADLWMLALERARPHFGRPYGASYYASDRMPVPYTPQTSPRHRGF